ncbi:MAG: hypothetical protein ACTH1W_09715, partial [Advenella sp.]
LLLIKESTEEYQKLTVPKRKRQQPDALIWPLPRPGSQCSTRLTAITYYDEQLTSSSRPHAGGCCA